MFQRRSRPWLNLKRPWKKSSQDCKRILRTWQKRSYNLLIRWKSKNKSSSKNLLLLLQARTLIFVSKWMMIYVHVALEVQSKDPTKKVMMIFQEPVNEHCKYDNPRIEFEEEEMDNLSRWLSVGSFNFGIGSIGSKHMDFAPTKIFPIDSSYIPQAKKVELRASPTN